jgi:XTP/dITP diphosphohydrolase
MSRQFYIATTNLYIATTNPGKLRDFAVAAESSGSRILALPGLESVPPAPENADTFEGNACGKAVYYSRLLPGEIVLADDSGLEVEVLNGAPGVRSARYAADAAFALSTTLSTDARNNLYLLEQLSGIEESRRGACYRCVVAAAADSKVLFVGHGAVQGRILNTPRGAGGFGYDPLFYLPELERSMAEIDLLEKHSLSHRGKAVRSLLLQLAQASAAGLI